MNHAAPGRALGFGPALALVVAACSEGGTPTSTSTQRAATGSEAAVETAAPRPARATELWFGGDVHWGNGRNVRSRLDELGRLAGGGAGFVNLEGPAIAKLDPGDGASISPKGVVTLSNDALFLPALHEAGVRFVGIANNHAEDRGRRGVDATRELLAKSGLAPIGLSAGVRTHELDGVTVHFAAYDLATNDQALRARELRAARDLGGLLVVSLHETGPPSYLPSRRLRDAVDTSLQLGANVVVSHGSHAVGPVERRGHAIIAWGLGNLLFDCSCTAERDGLLLRIRATRERLDATVIPIDAGLGDAAPAISHDPKLMLDLLESLGSSPLVRGDDRAAF